MKKFLIPTIVILAVATLVYLSVSTGVTSEEYATIIDADRKEKDDFLKNDPQSPFRDQSFKPLAYFKPDLAYRVNARLEEVTAKQVRVLATSTGEQAKYLDYAWAIFELQNEEHRLLILEVMDMGPNRGKLFLAFADETSARETYGGGRYLDLKKIPAATSMEIDFNRAYNPYCAYNASYSCPLPPRENLLSIPIRAGEKNFVH